MLMQMAGTWSRLRHSVQYMPNLHNMDRVACCSSGAHDVGFDGETGVFLRRQDFS
jgi:hypothetical protein